MNQANVSASFETSEKVLSNPLECSKGVGEYIEQSVLPARYGISKSTLSYRISKLKIKTYKRGRTCYLTSGQLELLDKLDKFCQSNDGAKIDKFLDSLESQEYLNKVCNPYGEEAEDTLERSNGIDESVWKRFLDEVVNLVNQSVSQNQIIDSERQLWIRHAVDSEQTINDLKIKNAEVETRYSNLYNYVLMQIDDKKRVEAELAQVKNILAVLNKNIQGENVVNFLSRQHQQKIPPYNPNTINHSS